MRVFVAGGAGAIGRYLIPALIADGHQVTASTRSAGKSADLAAAGAVPVVMDGLDRDAVLAAVQKAAPARGERVHSGHRGWRGAGHPLRRQPGQAASPRPGVGTGPGADGNSQN